MPGDRAHIERTGVSDPKHPRPTHERAAKFSWTLFRETTRVKKGAGLLVVRIGNAMVQNAVWLRCRACSTLWMKRRGEVVETKPRSGFERYA
jgi:hypothetical protein